MNRRCWCCRWPTERPTPVTGQATALPGQATATPGQPATTYAKFSTDVPSFADNRCLATLLEAHGVAIMATSRQAVSSLLTLLLSFGPTLLLIGGFLWLTTPDRPRLCWPPPTAPIKVTTLTRSRRGDVRRASGWRWRETPRQRDGEGTAIAWSAFQGDLTAVSTRNGVRDIQPQAGPLGGVIAR